MMTSTHSAMPWYLPRPAFGAAGQITAASQRLHGPSLQLPAVVLLGLVNLLCSLWTEI